MNIEFIVNNIKTVRSTDFYLTPWFFNNIYRHIKDSPQLGGGALGKAILIEHLGLVVKITSPCVKPDPIQLIQLYCENIPTDDQIIHIPHDKKLLIMIANYLCEGVIGGFLNRLEIYTHHFVKTHGIYYSKYSSEFYHVMDEVLTDVHTQLKIKADAYLMLFQIAHGLSTAQRYYKFTHYDLHSGNIGYQNAIENKYYQYHGDRIGTVYIKDPRFLIKIFDYGTSRLENSEEIINQLIDRLPIRSYGVFNPYYDFMAFVGSILYFNNSPISSRILYLLSVDEINQLFSVIFNESITADYAMNIYYRGWRPKDPDIRRSEKNFAGIDQILSYLVDNLKKLGVAYSRISEDMSGMNETSGKIQIEKLPFYEDVNMDHPIRVLPNSGGNFNIDNGIFTEIQTITRPWRNFNFTGRNNLSNKNLVLRLTYISSQIAKDNGYSFSTICCKMDPLDFMKNQYGVAINGSFFDIENTYRAIGQYRQLVNNTYYESSLPTDEIYQKYFGGITINEDGINIIQSMSYEDAYFNENVFLSGPLLIWQGIPLITEDTINQVEDIDGMMMKIFQCQHSNSTDIEIPLDGGFTFNCTQITPGQLSHGSNPNPRTMLITRENEPYDTIFVVVEGRTNRSNGADFLDLVEIAQQLGAYHAINLDGGTSSNMVWRSPVNKYIVGSTRITAYPVGNILAVHKQER